MVIATFDHVICIKEEVAQRTTSSFSCYLFVFATELDSKDQYLVIRTIPA